MHYFYGPTIHDKCLRVCVCTITCFLLEEIFTIIRFVLILLWFCFLCLLDTSGVTSTVLCFSSSGTDSKNKKVLYERGNKQAKL